MGEAKDNYIRRQIADDEHRQNEELEIEDRKVVVINLGHPPGCECAACMTRWKDTQYDPDHLRPDKGGNKAGDDYW